jgi:hypothetical protein
MVFCALTPHARVAELSGPSAVTVFCGVHLAAAMAFSVAHLDTPLRWWMAAAIVVCTGLCIINLWSAFMAEPGVVPPRDPARDSLRILRSGSGSAGAAAGAGDRREQERARASEQQRDRQQRAYLGAAAAGAATTAPAECASSSLTSPPATPDSSSSAQSIAPLMAPLPADAEPDTQGTEVARGDHPYPHVVLAHRFDDATELSIFVRSGDLRAGSSGEKFCRTCGRFRPRRAHHCRVCDHCVEEFDHHCGAVGACIARRNHGAFLRLLFFGAAASLCGTSMRFYFFLFFFPCLFIQITSHTHHTLHAHTHLHRRCPQSPISCGSRV